MKTSPCDKATSNLALQSAGVTAPAQTPVQGVHPNSGTSVGQSCGLTGAVAAFWHGLGNGRGTVLAAIIATFGVVATIRTTLRTSREDRISSTITKDRLEWLRELRVMCADLNAAFYALKLRAQQKANTACQQVVDALKEIELTSAFQKQVSLIELFLDPNHPGGVDARIQELVRKVADLTVSEQFDEAGLAMASLIKEVQSHTNIQWAEAVREAGNR